MWLTVCIAGGLLRPVWWRRPPWRSFWWPLRKVYGCLDVARTVAGLVGVARHYALVPDAGAAGADADAGAGRLATSRHGFFVGRHAGRRDWRAGAGRLGFFRRRHGGVCDLRGFFHGWLRAGFCCALRPCTATTRAGDFAYAAGRGRICVAAQGPAGRGVAGFVRGVAGRRGGAAADVRQRHFACRPVGGWACCVRRRLLARWSCQCC